MQSHRARSARHGAIVAVGLLLLGPARGDPAAISFAPSARTIDAYDFIEVTLNVEKPDAANPFTDVTVAGEFGKTGGVERLRVDGFCDSSDGSVYRIRFMPATPGDYSYSVKLRQGEFARTHEGTFQAKDAHRRGPVRVDPKYPWHFIWEGTGEHYFFNGTTAFWLMGWKEERIIHQSIERLHQLKVNRIRVLLAGATNTLFGEPVQLVDNFTVFLRPWIAQKPQSLDNPGIDYTRFDPGYWQKWERMLKFARDRDVIISVILDISMHKAQPAAGSEDERRYFRYAAARLGAFSNIAWDLGDDLNSYRDVAWERTMGPLLRGFDGGRHLITTHPAGDGRTRQERTADWFGHTSIQVWWRTEPMTQHALMLDERQIQAKTGRIIPQTNEEYGYEDHYPRWAPEPPGDSAETLRRVAWEIAMAGAYGTTGETARRGVNIWPDMGGGWVNGRGDDTMIMLRGYAHMVDFFASFDWWKTEPHDEFVSKGAFCLAQPGEIYAVYLPRGGTATVQLAPGSYAAKWFCAFTGEIVGLPTVIASGTSWTSPASPTNSGRMWADANALHRSSLDWALLLVRKLP